MTRRIALVAALMVSVAAFQPLAQSGAPDARTLRVGVESPSVVGAWKLVSYDTQTADGTKTFPLGQDLAGMAIYLPNGRVSIQFMRRDRPLFKSGDAWRGTLEEERAAFEGFFGYAGRYRSMPRDRSSPITSRSRTRRITSALISSVRSASSEIG